MKTLHVMHRIYPEYSGGTEIHIYELCQQLAKKNENVVVFTTQVDKNAKSISLKVENQANIKIYKLMIPPQNTKKKLLYHILFYKLHLIKSFYSILNKEKPDIVHFHHLIYLSSLLPILCWMKGIPNLIDLVDYWYLCPNDSFLCKGSTKVCANTCVWSQPLTIPEMILSKLKIKILQSLYGFVKVSLHKIKWKIIFNSSNEILVPISQRSREIYVNNGFRKEKMVIKPWGIPILKISKARTKKSTFNIGYIGTILPQKGIEFLITAFRYLPDKNVQLLLCGQNGYPQNKLENLIKNDKRIELHDSFDHKKVYKILQSFNLLVIPSVWEETFGLVVQEGLLADVPLIASRIGGIPERIHENVNGFLVNPNNSQELKEKILYVMKNYASIRKTLNFSIGQYSLDQEINQLQTMYQSLLTHKALIGVVFSSQKMNWIESN